MSTEADFAFWQSLRAARNAFVSLCGEDFHAMPLRSFVDDDSGALWVAIPHSSAMARRVKINCDAMLVTGSREGVFTAKAIGRLVVIDDEVTRMRLVRSGAARSCDLHQHLLAKFVLETGEAWVGATLQPVKLSFGRATQPAGPTADVVKLNA